MLLSNTDIELFKKLVKDKKIKALVFDLETSPSQFWGWSTGEQYVDVNMLVKGTETKIITSQYMDSLSNKPKYLEWDRDETGAGEDSSLVEETINIINEADILIGQNVQNFDLKVLRERAKIHRTTPLDPKIVIDTLTISKRSFRSMSHRLDYRSRQYGLGGKNKMEMQDWIDILENKVSIKKKMVPYGLKDILDTDKIFWNDLVYGELPQALCNKIKKLIRDHTHKEICARCAKRKKGSKYNVTVNKNKALCITCGDTWRIKW